MAGRSSGRRSVTRDQWRAQIAALDVKDSPRPTRKEPITVGRILAAALRLVEAEGFDGLTMRQISTALNTSPGALYVHVSSKAELDELLIAELCKHVVLPEPDAANWQEQITDVCRQLRDLYLRYPGISRAALSATPNVLDTFRVNEGMLAILIGAGVSARAAAWATDAALLYVAAYSLEASLRTDPVADIDGRILDRAELIKRFEMLPASRFPNMIACAHELNAGDGHDRFEFTLDLLFRGLLPHELHAKTTQERGE